MRKTILDEATGNVINVVELTDGSLWTPPRGQAIGPDGGEMGQRLDGAIYVVIPVPEPPEQIVW
jgi:hypothetical protein